MVLAGAGAAAFAGRLALRARVQCKSAILRACRRSAAPIGRAAPDRLWHDARHICWRPSTGNPQRKLPAAETHQAGRGASRHDASGAASDFDWRVDAARGSDCAARRVYIPPADRLDSGGFLGSQSLGRRTGALVAAGGLFDAIHAAGAVAGALWRTAPPPQLQHSGGVQHHAGDSVQDAGALRRADRSAAAATELARARSAQRRLAGDILELRALCRLSLLAALAFSNPGNGPQRPYSLIVRPSFTAIAGIGLGRTAKCMAALPLVGALALHGDWRHAALVLSAAGKHCCADSSSSGGNGLDAGHEHVQCAAHPPLFRCRRDTGAALWLRLNRVVLCRAGSGRAAAAAARPKQTALAGGANRADSHPCDSFAAGIPQV